MLTNLLLAEYLFSCPPLFYLDLQFQSRVTPGIWGHRAADDLPFLLGARILAGVTTRASGLGTSINYCYKLSQELNDNMEQNADSLTSLQMQLTSLATVTLQNQWALDLLTGEKGGTCLFL